MSSVAASLATNLIALRHCVAIRGSENDPLCLLWGPVARLLAPQDEATDHGVVVWSPPHPPVTTLILGPAKPPEIRPFWAEFLRFFGPCGAKSWGGGGAPPTTLILLRNQLAALQSVLGRAARRAENRSGGLSGRFGGQNQQCKECRLFEVCGEVCSCAVRGWRGGGVGDRCAMCPTYSVRFATAIRAQRLRS